MRVEVRADLLAFDLDELRERFVAVGDELNMDWQISDSAVRKRVVILVSKQMHCLYDLLERGYSGELAIDIPCVISNHADARSFVEWHGLVFHHIPVTRDNKPEAWTEIERLFTESGAGTMVLARFMQILPGDLCDRYAGQIINIHHSFLPSFVGAQPYLQAWQRGVKQVGATCHYVTADLDQARSSTRTSRASVTAIPSAIWCATARISKSPCSPAGCVITSTIG